MKSKEFNERLAKGEKFSREYFLDAKNLFDDYKELLNGLDTAQAKAYEVIRTDKDLKNLYEAVQIINFATSQKENVWKVWYSIPSYLPKEQKNDDTKGNAGNN
mgnify:CR=1 FL=1